MADGRVGVLSDDQARAAAVIDTMRGPNAKPGDTLLVSGAAGTGKTTMLREILRRWRYKYGEGGIILASPTHRANWVLRAMSKYRTSRWGSTVFNQETPVTLESLMGAKPGAYGKITYPEVQDAMDSRKPPPIAGLGKRSVLFVDEVSMADKEEISKLREWQAELGFGIVFLGDMDQLPPVGLAVSPVFAEGYRTEKLTQVMRQRGGNPLLDWLTDLRLGKQSKLATALNDATGEEIGRAHV
jgi:ATP-dependent exoDNAse (exonuclease V) alpha subunit